MIFFEIPVFFGISLEVYLIVILIALPTFYFWRWLYRKYIPLGWKRIFLTWLSTIIVSPIIYIGTVLIIFLYISYYPNRKFDKTRWKLHPDKRYELSQDLIKSKLLIGKTKGEVRQLLGNDAVGSDSTDVWGIDLGYRPELFNIDPSVLQIAFGNSHVVRVEQIH